MMKISLLKLANLDLMLLVVTVFLYSIGNENCSWNGLSFDKSEFIRNKLLMMVE